jgi:NADH-quinone oxidoreductase subunit J
MYKNLYLNKINGINSLGEMGVFENFKGEGVIFQLVPFSLAVMGIVSALLVIGLKNPVHAVFSLILTFCITAMLLLTLLADFLAITFVVVYVGAIAVLFLFVVMMLNIKFVQFTESIVRYIPFSIIIFLIFLSELYFTKIQLNLKSNFQMDWILYFKVSENIFLLAEVLYTEYAHIFIIAGLILLLAMLGTINITLYHAKNVKRQLLYKQLGRDVVSSISLKRK